MSELKNRNQILPEDKWSVEDLFSSDEAWQKLYDDIENSLSGFDKFKPLTMANLYECLNFRDEVYLNTERVYVYAGLRANEDSDNSFYQAMDSKAARLSSLVQAASAFIDSSIALLPEDEILKAVETEPLKLYAHYLKDILRSKEHILTQDKEEILAQMQEVAGVPSNVFYMLNNADLTFPDVVDSNGESHKLTHGTFISYLESSDRVLRKSAFNALYDTYKKQLNTITASYSGSVKVDSFGAKVRKYGSSLEAHLEPNNIPTSVYTQLIDTVNKNLNLMHRYISIRKKALGLDDLNMYDLYTPIVKDIDTKKTYEEAVETVKEAVKPLGEDYCKVFNKALDTDRWVDKYENKGKRSGAYSWGAYGCHPFVSMNYNGTVDSMFTLIHEMGHSMHSHYTWSTQPVVYGDYTIFVAEVASTVNEALLMEHLLKTTEDKNQRKYLINYYLEQFRGTLFRQTMFAEFELEVHRRDEAGEALTKEELNEIYYNLNKKYYGDEINIDEKISWEWARIPHFYTAFYVYQYATGYSAAIALSQRILKENGKDDYINFLKGGSSKYSIDLLKGAGVDMTTAEPVEKAMEVFASLLDEMENLLTEE